MTEHRCLDCGTDFDFDESKCPSCGSESHEEIESCKCTSCDWTGEINSSDPCPECMEDLEEEC